MIVTCPDCDLSYVLEDPDDVKHHANLHEEETAPDRPQPDARIAQLAGSRSGLIIFNKFSRNYLHEKLYGISRRFKREMGYDQSNWAPKGYQLEFGSIGVLFCDHHGRALGGAAIYADPYVNVSHMIAWVWIAPAYRRTGVLKRALPYLVELFPGALIQPDYSESMKSFAASSPYMFKECAIGKEYLLYLKQIK